MRQAISVAVLTRNAGPEFRLTLEMIGRQKIAAAVDVLAHVHLVGQGGAG